jgi:hypothetical protein
METQMPVTARLSRHFYERLGEQVATELVDWFNAVDATYRSELRDLNELNFARFDAKVGQRFAEFETRFAAFEKRSAEFEGRIERRLTEQTRFFFLAWGVQLAAVVGLWFRH